MTTGPERSPGAIFSNSAARKYGSTYEFWWDVYVLYEKALADDPCQSLDAFDIERTIHRQFGGRLIDVLVRNQPDAREYQQLRFTAFAEDADEGVREIPWWYWRSDDRPVLGEADPGGLHKPVVRTAASPELLASAGSRRRKSWGCRLNHVVSQSRAGTAAERARRLIAG